MPYSSIATITGYMSYGLTELTFFSKANKFAPISVNFFADHYWPEMSASTSRSVILYIEGRV